MLNQSMEGSFIPMKTLQLLALCIYITMMSVGADKSSTLNDEQTPKQQLYNLNFFSTSLFNLSSINYHFYNMGTY